MKSFNKNTLLKIALALFVLTIILDGMGCLENSQTKNTTSVSLDSATFVGSAKCQSCHKEAFSEWTGSHHQLAMLKASASTIYGDFNNTSFTHKNVTTTFFQRGEKYFVNTEGPDGKLGDFEIKYAIGVSPLQQYISEFPGGRLQCLSIAWDTEKNKWFSLHPNDKIEHDDWLHWTKGGQTWNMMCADCHTTNLHKNYNTERDTYQSTWSEFDVGCESCHGPASVHVDLMQSNKYQNTEISSNYGLLRPLTASDTVNEVESCAPCHSYRTQLTGSHKAGDAFLDDYLPEVLRAGAYHADGQMLDEVYSYGSFIQSKMFGKGVHCSNCHNPHNLKLRATGNLLCIRCHESNTYNTFSHTHHPGNSEGAQCINCHMPGKYYMVNDLRREHSLRIPRPDLSVKYGSPNACNNCHTGKKESPAWAASKIEQWFGKTRKAHFSEALCAARFNEAGAEEKLIQLIDNKTQPAIARATALLYLKNYLQPDNFKSVTDNLYDKDPLVRHMAVRCLESLPFEYRLQLLSPLLKDSSRAVRMEAVNLLTVEEGLKNFNKEQEQNYRKALQEYLLKLQFNSDFPSGEISKALFYGKQGKTKEAEESFLKALKLDNRFVDARIQLAYFYNQNNRIKEAESELRKIIQLYPDQGNAYYLLGLLLAENNRLEEAVVEMKQAADLLKNDNRVFYNWGLALLKLKRYKEAENILLQGLNLAPNSLNTLHSLALLYVDTKQFSEAKKYGEKLLRLAPNDATFQQLGSMIEQEMGKKLHGKLLYE